MAAKKSAPKIDAAPADVAAPLADMTTVFADAMPIAAFADAAREQYETALSAFNENAEKFRARTEEHMTTARESFEAASERLRAASADALSHARDEVTEAVDFANELARAKSISDALEIQRKYWTNLFETRVERARAFSEVSVEATRDAMKPFGKSLDSAAAFAPAFDKFFPFAGK